MKERFTPGPWAVWSCFRKKNGKLPVVHDESGDTVTICEVIDDKEHPEIADADAALIAAAPEMYKELEKHCALCALRHPEREGCKLCETRKVLNKARGRK